MDQQRRYMLQSLGAASLAAALPLQVWADSVIKTLKITLGFPAGDMADLIARTAAEKIRGTYAENVVIDNKPGAGGRLGVTSFVRLPKNGSELLFTPGSMLTLYPHVFAKLSYDALKDVVPLQKVAHSPFCVAVGPAVPDDIQDLKSYLAWAKKDPANAMYGSSGNGTPMHLTGAYVALLSGVPLTMVPYKGGSPAANDLVAAQIPAVFSTVATVIEFARSKKVRILAVSAAERMKALPDVPTFAESDYPDVVLEDWFGFFAPQGTDAAVVRKFQSDFAKNVDPQEMQKFLDKMGVTYHPSKSAEEFARFYKDSYDKWKVVAQAVKFQPMDS
ncbi:MAG: Bug family tripartite tricarboxylate transporter substrate binding protein [Comamonas sp.]